MKELSIEEKAKHYDDAIKKAKSKIKNDKDHIIYEDDVIEIFPELKENEDEKIRKDIINYFQCQSRDEPTRKDIHNKWIAWLEKQGEQKPAEEYNITGIGSKNAQGKLGEMIKNLKNDNEVLEQKPAEKVEPKFKVGDWVSGYYTNYKVLSVNNEGYVVEDVDGNKINILFENEKFHHLWTIKDAKDGDVLIDKSGSREGLFIFKETKSSNIKTDVLNPLTVLGYCGIGGAGFTKSEGWGDIANCTYYPATKEQRETLMKAMADAGYEWDAEKKELKLLITNGGDFDEKNCEQKHSIDINKMVDDYANSSERGNEEFGKPVPCMIRAYRQGLNDAIGKVVWNPAWSEEDEAHINGIIDYLLDYKLLVYEEDMNVANGVQKELDWLKSLKQRIGE